uniref:Uncharacterized protein AlNc14C251G9650 n=1 Tax=Albugo laibachii Nc14 TaxID=890382 RepID=F0WTH1_9STRA|nr:conserved hypothetical protein [Albugo laibachii Nc14]|eukprot:CCA24661.1 conserved hypothetical protein [Albugo laibachii Nc14]
MCGGIMSDNKFLDSLSVFVRQFGVFKASDIYMESELEGNEIADAESDAWKNAESTNKSFVQNEEVEAKTDDTIPASLDKADSTDANDEEECDPQMQLEDHIHGLVASHSEGSGQEIISDELREGGDELSRNKSMEDASYSALHYDNDTAISSSSGVELPLNPTQSYRPINADVPDADNASYRTSASPRPESEITRIASSSRKRRKSKAETATMQHSYSTETFSELLTSPGTPSFPTKPILYGGGQHGLYETNASTIDQISCASNFYDQSPMNKHSTPNSGPSGRMNFDALGNVMDCTPRSNTRPHLEGQYASYIGLQYPASSQPAREVRMVQGQIPISDAYVHATLAQLLNGPVSGYSNGNYYQVPANNIFEEEIIRMRSILSQHADLIPPPVEILRLSVIQNPEALQSAVAYSNHIQDAYGAKIQQQVFDHSRLQQTPQTHPGDNRSPPYVPWQSESDLQLRRKMIGKIISLLQARKPDAPPEWLRRLPDMARRLEDTLYRMAKNRDEYGNFTTLKSRLQHLAFTMGRRPPQPANSSVHVPANHDYMQEPPAFSVGMNAGLGSQQSYMMSGDSQYSSNANAMNASHLLHQSPMMDLPNASLVHSDSHQHQSDHLQRDYYCQQSGHDGRSPHIPYSAQRYQNQEELGQQTSQPPHHQQPDNCFYTMADSQYISSNFTGASRSDHTNSGLYQGYSHMDEKASNETSSSELKRNTPHSGGKKRSTSQEAGSANHSTSKRAKTGRKSTSKRVSSSPPPLSTASSDPPFPNSTGNTSEYRHHSHLSSQNSKSIET